MADDPLIDSQVDGRYRVTSVLGSGGMGTVYEGVHERLGRRVAIKVLQRGLGSDPTAFERFLREARIASSLGHGNIVDVSDLGQLPDGRPFLIMPMIDGVDLATMLRRDGPMSGPRVVQMLTGVADALDLVHAKGLVHRDVKPENLMHVVREDGSEVVMLLDFGIATLVAPDAARLTAAGRILGTPAYLSPETIRGGRPDRRSDVYALATVAYELMCGCLPFESENPTTLMTQKLSYDAPRLAEQTGRAFPEPVEIVMARGLTRDPDERYVSAGDLVAALQAAVNESAGFDWEEEASSWVDARQAATSQLAVRSRELSLSGSDAYSQAKVSPAMPASAELEGPIRRGRSRLLAVLLGVALLSAIAGVIAARAWPTDEPEPEVQLRKTPETVQPPIEVEPDPPRHVAQTAAAAADPPTLEPLPSPEPPKETRAPKRPARPVVTAPAPVPVPAPVKPEPAASAEPALSAADLNRLAASELLQGHLARAAEIYTRATKVAPNDAAAWRGLGVSSERLGRRADAIRAYERALAISPNGPQAESMRTRLQQLKAAK